MSGCHKGSARWSCRISAVTSAEGPDVPDVSVGGAEGLGWLADDDVGLAGVDVLKPGVVAAGVRVVSLIIC